MPFPTPSVDLTQMAKDGKLDPTIGRDEGMFSKYSVRMCELLVNVLLPQKYEEPFKVSVVE